MALGRKTSSSLRALCSWWRKRGKCWWYSGRIDESRSLAGVLHAFDRALHYRDGNALPDRFVLRPHGELAARVSAGVGQDAVGGELHKGAGGRAGEAGSARRLRVRVQSRQLHGHSGAIGVAAAAVPLFRQEGTVPYSVAGHAPAARRTSAGGPEQRHERKRDQRMSDVAMPVNVSWRAEEEGHGIEVGRIRRHDHDGRGARGDVFESGAGKEQADERMRQVIQLESLPRGLTSGTKDRYMQTGTCGFSRVSLAPVR